jgi:hypothetical protein
MSRPQLVLKQSTGCFTAGWQFGKALGELSDVALKLYGWLCLNVDWHTGQRHSTGALFGFEESGVLGRIGAPRTGRTKRVVAES